MLTVINRVMASLGEIRSPTTSATTYKTQGCGTHVAVRLRFGYDGSDDTMILMEIGA